MGDLTAQFSLKDFTGKPSIPDSTRKLLLSLCESILEPLSEFLQEPLTVTSGIRDSEDYGRLVAKGYKPSETSDHYFDFPIKIRNPEKIRKYGDVYTYGVGAADIVPKGGATNAWNRLLPLFSHRGIIHLPFRTIFVGQIIHETGKGDWIHVSNPYSVKFEEVFAKRMGLIRTDFLESSDSGKTYNLVSLTPKKEEV